MKMAGGCKSDSCKIRHLLGLLACVLLLAACSRSNVKPGTAPVYYSDARSVALLPTYGGVSARIVIVFTELHPPKHIPLP